jgi:hypothetical protein
MCQNAGKFLYEARPDILPYGYLTPLEMELWEMFYKERKSRQKNGRR